MRTIEDFNLDWKFAKAQQASSQPPGPDAPWQSVRLPHDWSIYEAFAHNSTSPSDQTPGGIGWYSKQLCMPETAAGKTTRIELDGVYNNSTLWINGVSLGDHPYGYTAFSRDLTPHLRYGASANTIAVRVDRRAYLDCRWYSGSGIYRNVKLVTTDPLSIDQWGTVITTPQISADACQVSLTNAISNRHNSPRRFNLTVQLFDEAGAQVSEATSRLELGANQRATYQQSHSIGAPHRWDIDSPYLYRVRCMISVDGNPVDQSETSFGIRQFDYDSATGARLNGRSILLKGVCLHQDGGGVGAAVPDGVWERRLRLLKEAGCNAIRTAHNPPSEGFLDLCDRMGFLVQDEAFDEFDHPKDKRKNYKERVAEEVTQGYTRYFGQWGETDIKSMVQRDRNHPSIVMWSLGNEVEWTYPNYGAATGYWDKTNEASYYWTLPPHDTETLKENFAALEHGDHVLAETAAKLSTWVREMDATRPVTANLVLPSIGHFSGYTDTLDMVGYSYRTVLYDYGRQNYPEKLIYGAENWCKWSEWKPALEKDFMPGIFLWTGINYLGETSTSGRRGSGSGLLDFAAFDTPSYHHFKTFWNDSPHVFASTVALAESDYKLDADDEVVDQEEGAWKRRTWGWQPYNLHWNYTAGQQIVVEVFLDEKSHGRKKLADFADRIIKWSLPFAPGTLRAVGRAPNADIAYTIHTAAEPAQIALSADKAAIAADGYDVVHLTAQLLDQSGNPVRHCEREITFDINGEYRLLATDNGANKARDRYDTPNCPTHNGRCLLILQSTEAPGPIAVQAKSDSIKSQPVTLAGQANTT
ncbi:MAG: DUF4982 domain-containing protein [Candidatus Latescibacteria bacterium]|nr:DUF4982 domain-containing protein [Candidatus Latescibacterota bacterium]